MPPFRLLPRLPAAAMLTYRIAAPASTHWRPGSCEEADCAAMANGWRTIVDEATGLGQAQAHFIRRESGRSFAEDREGGLTVFTFAAGQECFAEHQVPTGRPERFLVTGGDHRGNPTGFRRVHQRPADWVDDFQNHQDKIAELVRRG